jgi:hypothetical protein
LPWFLDIEKIYFEIKFFLVIPKTRAELDPDRTIFPDPDQKTDPKNRAGPT